MAEAALPTKGTRAADRRGDKVFEGFMWLLGCLATAGYAFVTTRRDSCSPR